jgi:hypothetical protein
MTMMTGHLAEPEGDGIAVNSYFCARGSTKVIGPLRAVVTAKGLTTGPGLAVAAEREASSGAEIAIRALLMRIGEA